MSIVPMESVMNFMMTLIAKWLSNSRAPKRAPQQETLIRHPGSTLIFGVLGFIFFAGLGLVFVAAGTITGWLMTALFLACALCCVVLIADFFLSRHRLVDGGIEHRHLTKRRGRIEWAEVTSVRFSSLNKWFVIETERGDVARISAMMIGLPALAEAILAHVPESAIEEETRALLTDVALGVLPELW
jgi:hypothetical protein